MYRMLARLSIGLPALMLLLPVVTSAKVATIATVSVTGILHEATLIVQLVIGLLVLMSIASWAMLFAKLVEIRQALRQFGQASDMLKQAHSLNDVSPSRDPHVNWLLEAARSELRHSEGLIWAGLSSGTSERVALMLSRAENQLARQIGRGVALFATVGSVSPFIGLFGTVWGIMHSFIGIAQANSTSLAVVAPGIAEALLATAVGLVVAIPATVMYNVIGRMVATYRARLTDCSATIVCMVGRDVERMRPVRGEAGAVHGGQR